MLDDRTIRKYRAVHVTEEAFEELQKLANKLNVDCALIATEAIEEFCANNQYLSQEDFENCDTKKLPSLQDDRI